MSDVEGNPRPYSAATLPAMADLVAEIDGKIAEQKVKRSQIIDELGMRYGTQLVALRVTTGKNTANIEADGVKVAGEVKKEVSYDNAMLKATAATMTWEAVLAVFKIDFSVSEVSYKALQTGAALSPEGKALFDQIEKARTVEYKPQPLKIERVKA